MISLSWIFIALSLVFLNAFFVAAEFGMVRLRHTRIAIIQETYGLRGKMLARVHNNLDSYLSACQLGITLASLGLGWVGEPAFSALLEPVFKFIGIISPSTIEFLAFFVAFSFLSFLHIVIGELMPKSLAIRQSEKVSVWTAAPLYGFYWLMFPAIWLLNTCSNLLLKLFNLNHVNKGEDFYSTDEIKLILNSSHLQGELSKYETEIIEHTLDFAELQVTDVMRPIEDIVTLDINQSIEQSLKTVMETRYSRYPVRDKMQKNIIGIVHVKDLLASFYQTKNISSLQQLVRPILKVSWHLPAIELLRKFREDMPHFAMIYRGSETAIGFITLDNLLHVLVGHIKDEFHKTKEDWSPTSDGGFLVVGSSPIYAIERALDIDIFSEDNATTVSGLIQNQLRNIPKIGEQIAFEEFTAVIEKMNGHRILQVKVYPKIKPLQSEEV